MDALNCLEIILMFHLDFHYGRITWEKVTKQMPRVAATIYREARLTPELAVFSQTAALWAIDLLLTAKMKSRMRSTHEEKDVTGEEARIPNVNIADQPAVSAVPDIADKRTDVLEQLPSSRPQVSELSASTRQSGNVHLSATHVQPESANNGAEAARIDRRAPQVIPTVRSNLKRTSRGGQLVVRNQN